MNTKALIINDRSWHQEVYIHIIDFCLRKNINVDILDLCTDLFNYKQFYLSFFSDNINYIDTVRIKDNNIFSDKDNNPYLKTFLPSDNFDYTKTFNINLPKNHMVNIFHKVVNSIKPKSLADKSIISIDHTPHKRNHLSTHVDIRHFSKQKPYAYPFTEIISLEEKKDILSKEQYTNILLVANPSNINPQKEIDTIKSFGNNFKIYWIHRNLSSVEYMRDDNTKIITNCNQQELHCTLSKIHYVYIPNLLNKNYKTDSTTAALNHAFNYCCQTIWPDRNFNKHYRLYSPIEFSSNLKIDSQPNVKLVNKERNEEIDRRDKIFSNLLK